MGNLRRPFSPPPAAHVLASQAYGSSGGGDKWAGFNRPANIYVVASAIETGEHRT